jgi:hypothetical protein
MPGDSPDVIPMLAYEDGFAARPQHAAIAQRISRATAGCSWNARSRVEPWRVLTSGVSPGIVRSVDRILRRRVECSSAAN